MRDVTPESAVVTRWTILFQPPRLKAGFHFLVLLLVAVVRWQYRAEWDVTGLATGGPLSVDDFKARLLLTANNISSDATLHSAGEPRDIQYTIMRMAWRHGHVIMMSLGHRTVFRNPLSSCAMGSKNIYQSSSPSLRHAGSCDVIVGLYSTAARIFSVLTFGHFWTHSGYHDNDEWNGVSTKLRKRFARWRRKRVQWYSSR